jgi:hypothetical protein
MVEYQLTNRNSNRRIAPFGITISKVSILLTDTSNAAPFELSNSTNTQTPRPLVVVSVK